MTAYPVYLDDENGRTYVWARLEDLGVSVPEPDARSDWMNLRTEYEIIQRLKQMRGQKEGEEEQDNLIFGPGDDIPTFGDAQRMVLEAAIGRFRPEKSWDWIADYLGITTRSLFTLRKRHNLYRKGTHTKNSQG